MARVFGRRPTSALARRAPSRAVQRKSRKHKVVMESVTQEKKKLRSVISFEAKAPPGYTFIPAGNPHLTTTCKEVCRKEGLKVFAVTTTPHMHTHNLSQHVHRIGYHFPSVVVSTVCMDLGLYLTTNGKAVPFHGASDAGDRRRANSEASQITINTEARDVLRDLFPNIPDNDLNQIIKTAFQKGQRKVGTAVELPLARRAQLAVVAHIRHVYTEYDRLLKATSFHEARSTVEEPTLAKLVEWRGDDENGKTVLEDVFREVIVISDDEDTDTDEGDVPQLDNRDLSVEIVASNARADELQMKPLNFANPLVRESVRDFSEDEAPPGFRFVPEVSRKNKIDRRGFSRYQAWDRAINRYRNATTGTDHQSRLRHHDSSDHRKPVYPMRQPVHENTRIEREPAGRRAMAHADSGLNKPISNTLAERRPFELLPLIETSRERNPKLAPLPEAVPLERAPIPQSENIPIQSHSSNAPVFVSGPRGPREKDEGQLGTHFRALAPLHNKPSFDSQDRVLPSIETPPSPLEIRRPDSGRLDHLTKRMSGGFSLRSVTPHRLPQDNSYRDLDENAMAQTSKRRRMAYYELPHHEIRSDITPGTVKPVAPSAIKDAYTGDRYIPVEPTSSEQFTSHDDFHIRRENLAPVDPRRLIGHQPERFQDSFVYPTGSNAIPEIFVGRRHIDDPQHEAGLYTRRRSPKQNHPHTISSASYSTSMDDSYDRAAPVYSADMRPRRVYHERRNVNFDGLRPLEAPEPHITPWRNNASDHLAPHEAPQRRQIYSEDFVRPVDLHEPKPMVYPVQWPHLRANHAAENILQPTSLRAYNDYHREELPNSRDPMVHLAPSRLDLRTSHPGLNHSDTIYHGGQVFNSSSAARHHEGQYQSPLDSARQTQYENQQRRLRTIEQHHPAYVRRVERPPSHIPEGRTVVIVD